MNLMIAGLGCGACCALIATASVLTGIWLPWYAYLTPLFAFWSFFAIYIVIEAIINMFRK